MANKKVGALTELIRGNAADKKVLDEAQRNHFVTVNSHLNKISNTLKYGNK